MCDNDKGAVVVHGTFPIVLYEEKQAMGGGEWSKILTFYARMDG